MKFPLASVRERDPDAKVAAWAGGHRKSDKLNGSVLERPVGSAWGPGTHALHAWHGGSNGQDVAMRRHTAGQA